MKIWKSRTGLDQNQDELESLRPESGHRTEPWPKNFDDF